MRFWAWPVSRSAATVESVLARGGYPISGPGGGPQAPQRRLPVSYACLRYIVARLGGLPVAAYGPDGRPAARPLWLDRPNRWHTWADFLSVCAVSLVHHGNLFLLPRFDAAGRVMEIGCPNPLQVDCRVDAGEVAYRVGGQAYPAEMVVHARYVVEPGQVLGLGALDAARKAMQVGEHSADLLVRHFRQGAQLQYVLSTPAELSDDTRREIAAQVHAQIVGPENAWFPLIIDGGLKAEAVSMTAEQAKFLEMSQWTDAKIAAQVYGLPPSVVGADDAATGRITYQNLSDRDAAIWRDALRPIASRVQTALSAMLPAGQSVRFDSRAMVGGSQRERLSAAMSMARINQAMGEAVYTPDEIREVTGHAGAGAA